MMLNKIDIIYCNYFLHMIHYIEEFVHTLFNIKEKVVKVVLVLQGDGLVSNFIGIDADVVRNVAQQCTAIQNELNDTSSKLTSQLSALQSALTGQAAQTFEEQFQKWQKYVSDMSQTLGTTASSLKQIADEADTQMSSLRSLASQTGY